MKPLEAWRVISANLTDLYKMRRALNNTDKGYTDTDVEAEIVCFMALKEAEERSKQPTGYGEPEKRYGSDVY